MSYGRLLLLIEVKVEVVLDVDKWQPEKRKLGSLDLTFTLISKTKTGNPCAGSVKDRSNLPVTPSVLTSVFTSTRFVPTVNMLERWYLNVIEESVSAVASTL
jgi:hypothetical protein